MKQFFLQLVVGLLLVLTVNTYGQNPPYNAFLMNQTNTATELEFDIYVKAMNAGNPFETYGLQVALIFDDAIRNGGTLSGIYIPGTSEMLAAQIPNNPNLAALVGTKRVFKLAAKIPSGPGAGTMLSLTGNGTRLGRFRITTTASTFANLPPNIAWNFDQATYGYATKFQAYVGGFPTEVTVQGNHFNNLSNDPVPVELNSLTASTSGREIQLNWETKTETNSSMFQVERRLQNSESWIKAGEINASGNSNSPKQYNFTDKKLNSGKYSYRLKMIDADGTFRYSNEVEAEVELPKEYAISQNYPNPFNPTTRIDYQLPFDSKVTLELYGITGEKVATIINSELSAGYYTADVNADALNLASGVYIYRINAQNPTGQNFVQVKKLMLTK